MFFQKNKSFVFKITSLILLIIAFYLILIYTNRQTILAAETIQQLRLIANQKKYTNDLVGSLRQSVNLDREINNYLVDEKNLVIFIEFIESIGKKSNVDLKIVSVAIEEIKTGTQKESVLTIKLNGQGKFSDVFYLLQLVESMPNKIIVLSSKVYPTSRSEQSKVDNGLWQLDLTFRVLGFVRK